MTPNGNIRVTQSEREGAVEKLRAAYSVGCLDDDELEDRISLAYTAKTRGDLADLVSDLPPESWLAQAEPGQAAPERDDWSQRARRLLVLGCWSMLAAAGAWMITMVAGGIVAVPLIFFWLVFLQLRGGLSLHRRRHAADPPPPGFPRSQTSPSLTRSTAPHGRKPQP